MSLENKIKKIESFIKVTPTFQISSLLIAAISSYPMYKSIESFSENNYLEAFVNLLGPSIGLFSIMYQEKLASKRYFEYKKTKNLLKKYGWNSKIIQAKSHSWCQRNMLITISKELGFKDKTKNYLYDKGYRWYHFKSE
jgi:hypothetical protein